MTTYDAGIERQRLASVFARIVNDEPGLDKATLLKELIAGTSRLADETREPLENILNTMEADAIDLTFCADFEEGDEPPRAAERFL